MPQDLQRAETQVRQMSLQLLRISVSLLLLVVQVLSARLHRISISRSFLSSAPRFLAIQPQSTGPPIHLGALTRRAALIQRIQLTFAGPYLPLQHLLRRSPSSQYRSTIHQRSRSRQRKQSLPLSRLQPVLSAAPPLARSSAAIWPPSTLAIGHNLPANMQADK